MTRDEYAWLYDIQLPEPALDDDEVEPWDPRDYE